MIITRDVIRINDRIDTIEPSAADLQALAVALLGTGPALSPHEFFAHPGTKRIRLLAEDFAATYDGDDPAMYPIKQRAQTTGYLSRPHAAIALRALLDRVA